jgi:predicted Zn-dependent peptidase
LYSELRRHTLSNSMRLWCLPRPNTGTVALYVHIPVGARTENKQNNGISHFLEHMVFTGTERWTEAEISEEVRRRGAQYNGQTSREETNYYLHIDATDLTFGLDWLHQILFKPTLSAEKIDKERQVIINEKGGEFDRLYRTWEWVEDHNFGWNVMRAVRRRIYPDSPMIFPVIGRDKTLNAITHQELVDYYQSYYSPNNMTLIAVGDVEPDIFFETAQAQFSDVPARHSPVTLPPFNISKTPFDITLQGPMPNDQSQLIIGAVTEAGSHPARFTLWVIEEMLDNALMKDIRYKLGLTYSVNVFTIFYSDTGYMGVYARAKQDDLTVIEQSVSHHLDRLVRGEFDADELEQAKTAIRGRTLLDLQDNLEMATWLAFDAHHVRGEDEEIVDYFASIEAVTSDDLRRVAANYLGENQRFRVLHKPVFTPKQVRPFALGLLGATATLLSLRRVGSGQRGE